MDLSCDNFNQSNNACSSLGGWQESMLLLLLSCFSRVRLCATPWTAAHQAPLSLGFSRQEHWSGLPFPSPIHESESESEAAQSCPALSYPMDCSLPGSSIQGIFQARVLEWGAIAFSKSNACSYLNKWMSFRKLATTKPCSPSLLLLYISGATINS